MRLSDIKGERVFDVIADIIEPALSIASDKEASRLFRAEKLPDGMTAEQFAMDKAKRCVPVLMRNHRDDLISILAALKGVGKDEYAKSLDMTSLVRDLYEMMTDEDLRAFLA